MFRIARIKLTAWYLLTSIIISIFFSLIIYAGAAHELERGFNRAEMVLRAQELGIHLPQRLNKPFQDKYPELRQVTPRVMLVENLDFAKTQLLRSLILMNGIILILSVGAGYFLAGKTLRPIKLVMDEQKRFIADASHELKTPLTSLKTSIEVGLRDKKFTGKKAKALLNSNLEEVEALNGLAGSLLTLAKIQQNGAKMLLENFYLNSAVINARKKIKVIAEKKKIKFEINIPEISIEADRQKFEEMLLIFLDNAVKYTPEKGKVKISAQHERKRVIIKIEDTGIGISRQHLPHIFDRFYRADEARSASKTEGFGLGLSLAKQIAESHQGKIQVESRVGKGTSFSIFWPLRQI